MWADLAGPEDGSAVKGIREEVNGALNPQGPAAVRGPRHRGNSVWVNRQGGSISALRGVRIQVSVEACPRARCLDLAVDGYRGEAHEGDTLGVSTVRSWITGTGFRYSGLRLARRPSRGFEAWELTSRAARSEYRELLRA